MANESIILELNGESDWNGSSEVALNRDHAIVTGQRYYRFNLVGPHGVLPADLGGLFSPVSPKLVGVAYTSWSPDSRMRVIASDPGGSIRQEVTLKSALQYVALHPGDRLSILTRDGGRGQLMLSVNEMTERDAVEWALRHEPHPTPIRLRIIRPFGAAFAPDLATNWPLHFASDSSTGILSATDNGTGVISMAALRLHPSWQRCHVSIRYAGSQSDGKLYIVDHLTRAAWAAETAMVDVKWSKAQLVSHDDGIALEASSAAVESLMVCDLEITQAHASDRRGEGL